jgi:streptogramin lyase
MTTAGTITATYPVSSGGYPFEMVVGPDGALWFTEEYGNMIGRLQ